MKIERAILVHIQNPYRGNKNQAHLVASARVAALIRELVNVLSLPVMQGNSPIVYQLYSEDDQPLDPRGTLIDNGITTDGRTLTIKGNTPVELPLLLRLKRRHSLNITWNCFRTGSCCDQTLLWNPTVVSVVLSSVDEEKSDRLFDHGIEPAIRGLGLRSDRVSVHGLSNEPVTDLPNTNVGEWDVPTMRKLCAICRSGLQDLLSIVDVTGRDPLVLLTLGLLWGHGQPVILTYRRGAFVQIPTDELSAIPYEYEDLNRDPDQYRSPFTSALQTRIQNMTGIKPIDFEGCQRCGRVFTSRDRMIVCLECRSRYHEECWSGHCKKCGKTSFICL